MHKPRHIPVCKWIARVVKLNNYLMEFPTPTGVKARKLEPEELLDVLENGIPTTWTFQMDKERFQCKLQHAQFFMETCVCYKECKPKETKESSAAHKSYISTSLKLYPSYLIATSAMTATATPGSETPLTKT